LLTPRKENQMDNVYWRYEVTYSKVIDSSRSNYSGSTFHVSFDKRQSRCVGLFVLLFSIFECLSVAAETVWVW